MIVYTEFVSFISFVLLRCYRMSLSAGSSEMPIPLPSSAVLSIRLAVLGSEGLREDMGVGYP